MPKSGSSLFSLPAFCHKCLNSLSGRGYFVERKQRWFVPFCSPVKASVFVLSTLLPRASPVPSLSQGENTTLPQSSCIVIISTHLKSLKAQGFFSFLLSSGSLKQRSDENAYLAFHIKVTPGWRSSAASCSETLYSLPSPFPRC